MWSLISQAFIIILLLTFSFGPAFFATINTAIKYGFKQAALLVLGILLSDLFLCALIVYLIHLGSLNFLESEKAQTFSGIIGGIILIVFGAFYFKKHVTISDESIELNTREPHPAFIIVKGFFLNLFNPTLWFLWIANVTAVGKSLEYSMIKIGLFFTITLSIVLFIELGKVYLAGKIKQYLTDRLMTLVNYLTGSALMIFGLLLIYNFFFAK